MSVRDSFVARFGEAEARIMEAAAIEHNNEVHSNRGSDPFKWAYLICVGSECFIKDSYREYHGFTVPCEEIEKWAIEEGNMGSHDGDIDYLALFTGVYDKYKGG